MKTPKRKSRKKALTLPGMEGVDHPETVWFANYGCVVRDGERRTLLIDKRQVGAWEPGEERIRNALMVQLAADPTIILEDLAEAFGVTSETLRQQRRRFEAKGLKAVLTAPEPHHKGGRRIEPAVRRRMEQLFKQGKSTAEVTAALEGQAKCGTVEKYRRLWKQKQARRPKPAQQAALPLAPALAAAKAKGAPEPAAPAPGAAGEAGSAANDAGAAPPPTTAGAERSGEVLPPIRAPQQETSERMGRESPIAEPAPPETKGAFAKIAEFAPFSAKGVQHVGAWLLLVALGGLGLYERLHEHEKRRPKGRPLRVAVDAVVTALAMGGRCVEAVRRLATSTAAALLLADAAPSATWVRRTLGGYCAKQTSEKLLADVSGDLLREAKRCRRRGEPVVLFFDNHGRQYTGRHLMRRIWRMQAKRTVPGAMDYWIHDVRGRPVQVVPVEPNVSLPEAIRSTVAFLREKLGKDTPLLLVFDRAGAFPGLWKWLREQGVEFVTYQRAKYRKFSREWFARNGEPTVLREADGTRVQALMQDGNKNLGNKRGRVRRIRILMPDDAQVNVVAWSRRPARWLCQTLFARWRQENGLRHAVQRWGLNQLDGRVVEDVPKGTLVTNPLHTNLDRMLRDDKKREKELRLQLQQMYPGHPERRAKKEALKANLRTQREIRAARKKTPPKVPIEETALHGKLKRHTREYKVLLDTLRCAAQNAEGDLAASLARHMKRPAEAKRLLQNLFSAPGTIRVSAKTITVTLMPAANAPERVALEAFLAEFNRRQLCHPGDPFSRHVRFQLQIP